VVPPTQSPDPRARRNAAILVLAMAGLGLIAMLATNRFVADLRELAEVDAGLAIEQASRAIKLLAMTLGLGLAAFAWWLFRLSLRTQQFELFPPPGQRVIRETRILSGEAARTRARFGFGLAAASAAAAILLPVYLWYITARLAAL